MNAEQARGAIENVCAGNVDRVELLRQLGVWRWLIVFVTEWRLLLELVRVSSASNTSAPSNPATATTISIRPARSSAALNSRAPGA